jgi:prepilin-type N-terminal cleavage/methylation domain-containing protein
MKLMKKIREFKFKRGFTLVECLIAIMVFSIMSGIIVMLLNAAITNHRRNMADARSLREQRDALMQDAGKFFGGGADDRQLTVVRDKNLVEFNFSGIASVQYDLTAVVADEDELDEDVGLQISSVIPTKSGDKAQNIPAIKISDSLKHPVTKTPIVDVVISSPASSTLGVATPATQPAGITGSVGAKRHSDDGIGNIYAFGSNNYASMLRIEVEKDKRPTGSKVDEAWIVINIFDKPRSTTDDTEPENCDKILGIVHDGKYSSYVKFLKEGDTDRTTLGTTEEKKLLEGHYQIVITKPAGDPEFQKDYTFAIISTGLPKGVQELIGLK